MSFLHRVEECKAARCPNLIRDKYCTRYGELNLFSCPDLDIAEARREAGLWCVKYGR